MLTAASEESRRFNQWQSFLCVRPAQHTHIFLQCWPSRPSIKLFVLLSNSCSFLFLLPSDGEWVKSRICQTLWWGIRGPKPWEQQENLTKKFFRIVGFRPGRFLDRRRTKSFPRKIKLFSIVSHFDTGRLVNGRKENAVLLEGRLLDIIILFQPRFVLLLF